MDQSGWGRWLARQVASNAFWNWLFASPWWAKGAAPVLAFLSAIGLRTYGAPWPLMLLAALAACAAVLFIGQQLDALVERVGDRMAPLDIFYDGSASCAQDDWWTATEPHHIVQQFRRVKVRNRSKTQTLRDVRVVVERIRPQDAPFLPLPLREMTDNPEPLHPFVTAFRLNPGELRMVSVVRKIPMGPDPVDHDHIHWQWASWDWPTPAPDGEYVVTITATAGGIRHRTRRFRVWVDSDRRIHMEAA